LLIGKYADLQALIPAQHVAAMGAGADREIQDKGARPVRELHAGDRKAGRGTAGGKTAGRHPRQNETDGEGNRGTGAGQGAAAGVAAALYADRAHVVMRPPLVAPIERPPTRILSVEQYRVELVAKAEMARARVPPEYRPRMAVKDVIWDTVAARHDENSLGYHFHTGPPATNGGLARAATANYTSVQCNGKSNTREALQTEGKHRVWCGLSDWSTTTSK
jgi:hypothetical protein